MFRDYAHRGEVFAPRCAGLAGNERSPQRSIARRNATACCPGCTHAAACVAAIVLLGLVMVTSASITVAAARERRSLCPTWSASCCCVAAGLAARRALIFAVPIAPHRTLACRC